MLLLLPFLRRIKNYFQVLKYLKQFSVTALKWLQIFCLGCICLRDNAHIVFFTSSFCTLCASFNLFLEFAMQNWWRWAGELWMETIVMWGSIMVVSFQSSSNHIIWLLRSHVIYFPFNFVYSGSFLLFEKLLEERLVSSEWDAHNTSGVSSQALESSRHWKLNTWCGWIGSVYLGSLCSAW